MSKYLFYLQKSAQTYQINKERKNELKEQKVYALLFHISIILTLLLMYYCSLTVLGFNLLIYFYYCIQLLMHYLKPNSKQPLFASVQKSTIPDIVPSSSIEAADEQMQNLGKQSELMINNSIAHDARVDTMIKEQLDNSFSVYGNKSKVENKINKSKSLVTLASKGLKPAMSSQQILEKRFKQSKQEVSNQIAGLEKQCDKFGGHIYIRNQMDKQQITPEELYNFYKERITSIHGSLTLPKLNTRQQPNPTIGQHKSAKTSPSSSSLKYNKWYIQPSKRFTIQQLNQQQNMKRVTQYIDKILKDKRDKVTIRQQYAPIIVKQSARRLGRNPVICSYAEISRR